MIEQIIEREAASLEEARASLKSSIPIGFDFISETVLSDGMPKVIQSSAETVETAFAELQRQVPPHAQIIDKREITLPEVIVVKVLARNEEEVKATTGNIRAIRLVTLGNKGLLGIGRRPHHYEVEVMQPAIVEITYQEKAKIVARISKKETCSLCGGTGESNENCLSCGGMGWLGGGASYSTLGDRCTDCIRGKIPCANCGGTGQC